MRIISWNCNSHNGCFSEDKYNIITTSDPDLLIVQECSYFNCIKLQNKYANICWYCDGKDSNLGIGLFSKNYVMSLMIHHYYDNKFRYIIPYNVTGNNKNLNILVVWTKNYIKNDKIHTLSYVENLHSALDYYFNGINNFDIVIGDFNSNTKWDNKYRKQFNHTSLINRLSVLNFVNCAEIYNIDKEPTYYYTNKNRKFSVTDDYCFINTNKKIKIKDFGSSGNMVEKG
jgi:exonuclease III